MCKKCLAKGRCVGPAVNRATGTGDCLLANPERTSLVAEGVPPTSGANIPSGAGTGPCHGAGSREKQDARLAAERAFVGDLDVIHDHRRSRAEKCRLLVLLAR